MEQKTIGQRIKNIRKKKNLTQPDLAGKLEELRMKYYPDLKPITRNDIANWEDEKDDFKSKRTLIKASDVHLLSLVFGVDCDYIITGIRKADETIVDQLGLSQKLIDELKEDQPYAEENKGWARVFNFLCEYNCYDMLDYFVDFLQEDFSRNYKMEACRLIDRLIGEGKIDRDTLDTDLLNYLAYEACQYDEIDVAALRFMDEIKDENKRIHSEKANKMMVTIIEKAGRSHQQEMDRRYMNPQRAKAIDARENKGGSEDGEAR